MIAATAGYSYVRLALTYHSDGASFTYLEKAFPNTLARASLSAASLLFFLAVNVIGAAAMGRAEDIAVYVKILLLAVLAVVGLYTADPSRFRPLPALDGTA